MKNLNTIVPFYDSTAEQFFRKQDLQLTRKYFRLVCGVKRLTPFIIRRNHSSGTKTYISFRVIDADTGAVLFTDSTFAHLTIVTGVAYDYIIYMATADFSSDLPIGVTCYAEIIDTYPTPDKYWYSELFMTVASLSKYTLLTFSDDNQLSNIYAGFEQKMYIDNIFKVREYIRKDTGTERDGIMVKESMVCAYVDNINLLQAPQFITDALLLLPMMDDIGITDQFGDCYTPLEVKVKDPEWSQDSGGVEAKLQIQFTKEIVIKRLTFREMGCNSNAASAIINQGVDTLVAMTPKTIYYDHLFTGTTYSLIVRARDGSGNLVLNNDPTKAVGSFTITSLESCTIDWIAVEL